MQKRAGGASSSRGVTRIPYSGWRHIRSQTRPRRLGNPWRVASGPQHSPRLHGHVETPPHSEYRLGVTEVINAALVDNDYELVTPVVEITL